MNKEEAKELKPVFDAFCEGREIEVNRFGDWRSITSLKDFWVNPDINSYRIKPAKQFRPWKPEEVPVGALIIDDWIKDSKNDPLVILGVCNDCTIYSYKMILSGQTHSGNDVYLSDAFTSKTNFKYSTDFGKTWLPCGVEK